MPCDAESPCASGADENGPLTPGMSEPPAVAAGGSPLRPACHRSLRRAPEIRRADGRQGSGPYPESVVTLRIYTMPHRGQDVNTPGQTIDYIALGQADPCHTAPACPAPGGARYGEFHVSRRQGSPRQAGGAVPDLYPDR